MPTLTQHHSTSYVKALCIGDSGSAKTGGLISLVEAGYKLAIIDTDNGLDVLVHYIQDRCPDKLENVYFKTCTDPLKAGSDGKVVPNGKVRAFSEAMNLLTRWKTDIEDLGITGQLGEDWVVVIDSMTLLGDAAFRRAQSLNPNTRDPRQWYKQAQDDLLHMLQLLYSESFQANVIVNSHITYIDQDETTIKGYPLAVGKALSPQLGRYFNSALLFTHRGAGKNMKRYIQTISSPFIDLKTPNPHVPAELPLDGGLAKYFSYIKGDLEQNSKSQKQQA